MPQNPAKDAFEVKILAYEATSFAYDVKIRAHEVKMNATLLKHGYYLALASNISALAVLIDLLLEDGGQDPGPKTLPPKSR